VGSTRDPLRRETHTFSEVPVFLSKGGPLIKLARHLVQFGLEVRRKVKAYGEVLAQQAIGIFAMQADCAATGC